MRRSRGKADGRWAWGLALLVGLPAISCAPGEAPGDEEPVPAVEAPAPAPSGLEPHPEPPVRDDHPAPTAVEPRAPAPAERPAPAAPARPREDPRTLPAAAPRDPPGVVHGRVEIRIDSRTSMPADYLLVRLRAGRSARDAWTTRDGGFYFENVPPGVHELEVLRSPREARPIFRARVEVEPGASVRVPSVTIPVDSIKSGGSLGG